MSEDVLGYLERKGLNPKRAGGYEFHLACPFCGEDPGKRGRMYVNTDPEAAIPGLFHCKICDERGALVSLKRHFGDQIQPAEEDYGLLREILADAAAYYHDQLGNNEQALTWLRERRGLTVETIVDRQLGWADGHLQAHLRTKGYKLSDMIKTGLVTEGARLVDSLNDMVTIPYQVAGNVVMIRGRLFPYKGDGYPDEKDGSKYKTPSGQSSRLFNSDAVWGADEITVAEGEFDAIILAQHGFAAIAVPGANTWQPAWDGYITDLRRIFLALDNDAAGNLGTGKLMERLGKRARPLDLPIGVDVTAYFVGGHSTSDFQALIDGARGSGLLITVDEAAAEHALIQGMPGLKLGIEELDLMLNPGLLAAQVMVILAKAGAGKTLFLLNLFELVCVAQPDAKILFVSLEQTRGEWFERARRIFRFYRPDATDAQCLDFWRDRLLLVDKNRFSEEELRSVLDEFKDRMGCYPAVTALDYLGYFAQGFKGDRYERTSDAVMALKATSKDYQMPIISPHQVSRVAKYGQEPDADAARDAGVVEETADFLFTLWSQDHALGKDDDDKTGEVLLRVGKSRHGGRGTKVTFQFAPLTLAMVPLVGAQSVHVARARDELVYVRNHDDWETALRRHRREIAYGETLNPNVMDTARGARTLPKERNKQTDLKLLKS